MTLFILGRYVFIIHFTKYVSFGTKSQSVGRKGRHFSIHVNSLSNKEKVCKSKM